MSISIFLTDDEILALYDLLANKESSIELPKELSALKNTIVEAVPDLYTFQFVVGSQQVISLEAKVTASSRARATTLLIEYLHDVQDLNLLRHLTHTRTSERSREGVRTIGLHLQGDYISINDITEEYPIGYPIK